MSSKLLMGVFFMFIAGNIICMFISGDYLTSADMDFLNFITGYNVAETLDDWGLIGFPILGWGFLTNGIWTAISWNYPFLDGDMALFKWFLLYPISAGTVYGIYTAIRGR